MNGNPRCRWCGSNHLAGCSVWSTNVLEKETVRLAGQPVFLVGKGVLLHVELNSVEFQTLSLPYGRMQRFDPPPTPDEMMQMNVVT